MNNLEIKLSESQFVQNAGRPITYFPKWGRVLGVTEAIFTQQLLYWMPKAADEDGWVYKTFEEWEAETGLSTKQLQRIQKKLIGMNILKVKHERLIHRKYYQIDMDVLDQYLNPPSNQRGFPEMTKGKFGNCQKVSSGDDERSVRTIDTESTAESTAESTNNPPTPQRGDDVPPFHSGLPPIPYDEIVAEWNSTPLPRIERLTRERKEKIRSRWKDQYFRENWKTAIKTAGASEFLCGGGRPKNPGEKPFVMDIGWFLKNDTNFTKIMEGKYGEVKKEAKRLTKEEFEAECRKRGWNPEEVGNY